MYFTIILNNIVIIYTDIENAHLHLDVSLLNE